MNKNIVVPSINLGMAKSFTCNFDPSPFRGEFLKSKGCDGVAHITTESVAVLLYECMRSFSTDDGHRIHRNVEFKCDKCGYRHIVSFDESGLKIELKTIEELTKND